MKRKFIYLTTILCATMFASTTLAQNYHCVRSSDDEAHLLTLNITTGAQVDSIGVNITNSTETVDGFNGMAKDPTSGLVYVAFKDNNNNRSLGTINVSTGDINTIGTITFQCASITFDAAGNLYGMRGNASTQLYSINKATCASTLIHSYATDGDDGEAICVNTTDGLLYRYDGGADGNWTSLNLTTFAETNIATLTGIDTWGPGLHYNSSTNSFILAAGDYFYSLSTAGTVVTLGNVTNNGYSGSFKGLLPASTVGLSEEALINFEVFPNPSSGTISIDVNEDFNLEVIDITGKVVQKHQNVKSISIENDGVYLLRFTSGNQSFTKKVIVQ